MKRCGEPIRGIVYESHGATGAMGKAVVTMSDVIKVETVRTESFEMDYFRFGHGSESLVILPGVSVQSVMLLPNIVAAAYKVLTDDFTVYVVDRRKNVKDGYSIAEMAEDTA